MAGYSGTPLPNKLGIKEGHRVALLSAPRELPSGLSDMPKGVTMTRRASAGSFDVILFFTDKQADLAKRFAETAKRLEPNGGLR